MLPLATAVAGGAERHASGLGEHIMDGGAGTATTVAIKPACLWCDTAFERCQGGSPQRFCTSKCREEFHSAGRRYAEHAVLSGQLTVADLRNGSPEACTLLPAQEHDPEQFRDRRAAADAVIELTNAAIALRLRPSM